MTIFLTSCAPAVHILLLIHQLNAGIPGPTNGTHTDAHTLVTYDGIWQTSQATLHPDYLGFVHEEAHPFHHGVRQGDKYGRADNVVAGAVSGLAGSGIVGVHVRVDRVHSQPCKFV